MRYNTLFSVDYFHEYYKSKRFNGFDVALSAETQKHFDAYGLLFRAQDTGFTILCKENKRNEENELRASLLTTLKDKLVLSFYLFQKDTFFMQYSSVPGNSMEDGYWFSNLSGNDKDESVIHNDTFVSEPDRVHFLKKIETLPSMYKEGDSLKIEDKFGATLYEGTSEDLTNQLLEDSLRKTGLVKEEDGDETDKENDKVLLIDSLCETRLLIVESNGEKKRYYYRAKIASGLIGIIDIIIDPNGTKNTFEQILGSLYKIAFNSRSITWRYNLINRDKNKYKEFKVIVGKEEIPMTEAKETKMINGEMGYQLETTTPILLKEYYDRKVVMEMIKMNADRNIKKTINLPVPDKSKIRVAKVDDEYQAYSEMYIYF